MNLDKRTRKDVLDWLRAEGASWAGRLTDEAFLDRIADLDSLPSTDPRFKTARQDIWQHRINNDDWENDWVFDYAPLGLLSTSDELFLAFLTEMLHPVVRPDESQARSLAAELNDLLAQSGFELYEARSIGSRPVWAARRTSGSASLPDVSMRHQRTSLTTDGLDRIWEPRMFRLFLSHVSQHGVVVSKLKSALAILGVSAFVAHEDIEPSLDWQGEIESALRSMHAMAALITPDFHTSNWTDQEVGSAVGQGILVIPVRIPTNPYGFIARHQALRGDLETPKVLASALVTVLLNRAQTSDRMREALVLALSRSSSYAATKELIGQIESTSGFSEAQLLAMERAIRENDQVSDYAGVTRLRRYVDARGA